MIHRPLHPLLAAVLLFALQAGQPAAGKVFLHREQALRQHFGESAEFRRESLFLTDNQVADARDLAGSGVEIREAVLTRYTAWRGKTLLGTAYLETHRVRTLPQTILVFVNPQGRLDTIEILAFGEPEEYLPRRNWLDQFRNEQLDGGLAVGSRIHGMTGATLSAHAVTDAARRVLALHRTLEGGP